MVSNHSEHSSSWVRWVLTLTVVLVTALEILDGTIISVSIRSIEGALAATKDQLTWMMTGYLITSAIVVLLAGYLSDVFGRRQVILWSLVAFMVFSMGCGMAQTPQEIIVFRLLQGVFGGLLAPLSQAVLNTVHTRKTRPMANALFGVGLMSAPIFGPILGGIITDQLSWRWDFFINLPVCVLAWVLVFLLLPGQNHQQTRRFDVLGLALMIIAVGFFQYVMDNGNDQGWFDSLRITLMTVTCVITGVWFVWRGLRLNAQNIVDLSVLRDPSFCRCIAFLFVYCMGFIGTVSWLPNYMEAFMGYTATMAGETSASRGIASAVSLLCVPLLMRFVSTRWILLSSLVFYIAGSFFLLQLSTNVGSNFFHLPNILQGVSVGLFFIPIATEAYRNVPDNMRDTASGLFNFFRTVGSSAGVALFSTIVVHQTSVNWRVLGGRINQFNPSYLQWLTVHGMTNPKDPKALQMVAGEVFKQASTNAYVDAFFVIMLMFALMVPLVLVVRWAKTTQ